MSYNIQNFENGKTLKAEHLQNIENAILDNEVNISELKKELNNVSHPLYGLNVLCLGDSITYGQGMTTTTRWANVLASKYNWNLTVKAQGGIALSSYWYTTNSSTDISIAKKAEDIKTMTTKPDIVLVWGGHNDLSYRYTPLGEWSDSDSNSFRGALKYISKLVHQNAPKATLFVLTQEWIYWDAPTLKVPEGTTDTGADFDKAVFEGAYLYGWVPISMQHCGITPYTKATYTGDGIHPNASGTELIVNFLSNELTKYYRVPDLSKVSVESISLNKSTTTVLKGSAETLIANITPSNATNTSIVWSSSNDSVASVNSNGVVTGIETGTAVITAKTIDGNLVDSCIINVSSTATDVSGISLDKTSHTCQQSTNFVLSVSFNPSNATNQNITWQSSDNEVAIVTGGFVKALREGNAIITATSVDGGYTATCNLTVTV